MSRPSKFSDKLADEICGRLTEGEGLRAICRDPAMPHRATVLRWLADPERSDFATKYAHAREIQADFLDEEMQDVADKATPENVNVARLRVLTMQWRASKLAPKKYGDKLDITTAGSVAVTLDTPDPDKLAELQALAAANGVAIVTDRKA